MDTGYPAMIPEVQSQKEKKETQGELAALEYPRGTENQDSPDSIPPCIHLKG